MHRHLLALCFFAAFMSAQLSAHEVTTIQHKGILFTSGWVSSTGWHEKGLSILKDFVHYRDWAVRWMDGKDDVSKNFWALFTDFIYQKPNFMTLVYDVNLGWPLGSTGNKAKFVIDESQVRSEVVRFILQEKPFGVEDAQLIFSGEHLPDGNTRFRFSFQVKFAWVFLGLIDFKAYSRDMDWRINKMIENLQEAADFTPETPNPDAPQPEFRS